MSRSSLAEALLNTKCNVLALLPRWVRIAVRPSLGCMDVRQALTKYKQTSLQTLIGPTIHSEGRDSDAVLATTSGRLRLSICVEAQVSHRNTALEARDGAARVVLPSLQPLHFGLQAREALAPTVVETPLAPERRSGRGKTPTAKSWKRLLATPLTESHVRRPPFAPPTSRILRTPRKQQAPRKPPQPLTMRLRLGRRRQGRCCRVSSRWMSEPRRVTRTPLPGPRQRLPPKPPEANACAAHRETKS